MLKERLHNQQLAGSRFDRAEDVVGWLGAVQAQDYVGAKWALALRARRLSDALVEEAFNSGRILRTHVLRPTWHFVTPADIRWMVALTAPRIHRVNRGYGRKVGLDDKAFTRARGVIERALDGGKTLTRRELQAALRKARLNVAGQALAFVTIDAELAGIVCSGPRRGREFTYALVRDRAPKAKILAREEALAELTRRYFQSHGPATVRDFSWWSGLTMKDARTGIDMVKPDVLAEAPGLDRVRGATYLLSNYDEYLIAYKDRGAVLDPADVGNTAGRVTYEFPHQVVVDGRVAGSWSRVLGSTSGRAVLRPGRTLPAAALRTLRAQADAYARFLGRPFEIQLQV